MLGASDTCSRHEVVLGEAGYQDASSKQSTSCERSGCFCRGQAAFNL